jgi:hypothetical protein
MAYKIAGIDVHKKMLAVVVCDVELDGEYQFARRMFGGNPEQLRALAAWLLDEGVEKRSWNRPRCTGDRYGKRWRCTGSRSANSVMTAGQDRQRCIWPWRYPIAEGVGARGISPMPNDW